MPPAEVTEQDTVEDAEKTIGSLNKYIEEFNKQRDKFMNSVRPKKKTNFGVTENSQDMEDNSYESE